MAKRNHKTVLFLCTGNYYRSRYAEIYFNAMAAKMGLPWKAISRGLALERGVNNVGPMAPTALAALSALGLRDIEATSRLPIPAMVGDFEKADFVVALKRVEHEPLLQDRFPPWLEKTEFWHVDDAPEIFGLIEREVTDLTARLITGAKRQDLPVQPPAPQPTNPKEKPTGGVVRLGRETKGRRGKGVTIVFDIPLDEAGVLELAATLKQKCGTGGTAKDGRIEIQGDQRERLATVLEAMGYRVIRVGG